MEKMNGFANKRVSLASLAVMFLLLLAACSPSTASQYGAAPQATKAANPVATTNNVPVTGSAAIQVADNAKLGKILVNDKGMTLYFFEIDTPTESKCVQSDCVTFWPPLTVTGNPQAGDGVTGKLTTIARPDGSKQVVYEGHPLYTFSGDKKPGDTTGHGLNVNGGEWYSITPAGEEAGGSTSAGQPAAAPQYPNY